MGTIRFTYPSQATHLRAEMRRDARIPHLTDGLQAELQPRRNPDSNPFDFPSRGRYSYAQIDEEVLELREYEIVYVIRPDLSEEDRSTKIERIHSLISENGGEIGKVEDWGKRVLAYEIKHNTEGYYGLAEFRLPPGSVRTVEDRLNIDEEILRYQIISRS